MPPNPDEPDKYSLDDMLERLQSKPDASAEDSGELVTRADGTQAIKVRKRKRRSTQPHKEAAQRSSRVRAIQISAAVLVLLLLVLTCGGFIVYANSAPYRRSIVDKVSAVTGAKTSFQQFRVNPTASNIVQAEFQWPEGNLLKSLNLTGIQTKALIFGLVGKGLGVDEIIASSGRLHISPAKAGEPRRLTNQTTGPAPIIFERLAVNKLEAVIGNPAQPAIHILNSEASLYPDSISGHPSVRLFKGEAKIPDWPALRLDRALMEFPASKVDIVSLRLLHESDMTGNIELSGNFDPYATGAAQKLAVKVDSMKFDALAGPTLGRLFEGRISTREGETPNELAFSPDGGSASSAKLAYSSAAHSSTTLNNFPFLSVMSRLFENHWLASPVFEQPGTGTLQREKGIVRLTGLSFNAPGQLHLTGDLTLGAEDALSGILNLGVPEAAIITTPDKKLKAIFSESRDGLRWIQLKISGTGARPADNLAEIYESPAQGGTQSAPSQGSFEELTAPR